MKTDPRAAILAAALGLSGCSGGRGDSAVCTPIIEPREASGVEDSLENQRSPEWQRVRAEACVHRQAYRLATSSDPAPTVAKAVVVYCENPIDAVARVSAFAERDPLAIRTPSDGTMKVIDDRIAEIKTNFESFALSKVVEGRAGKCRV